ncbi:hypothetical protein AB6D11_00500 [Vibrio splendidus]
MLVFFRQSNKSPICGDMKRLTSGELFIRGYEYTTVYDVKLGEKVKAFVSRNGAPGYQWYKFNKDPDAFECPQVSHHRNVYLKEGVKRFATTTVGSLTNFLPEHSVFIHNPKGAESDTEWPLSVTVNKWTTCPNCQGSRSVDKVVRVGAKLQYKIPLRGKETFVNREGVLKIVRSRKLEPGHLILLTPNPNLTHKVRLAHVHPSNSLTPKELSSMKACDCGSRHNHSDSQGR